MNWADYSESEEEEVQVPQQGPRDHSAEKPERFPQKTPRNQNRGKNKKPNAKPKKTGQSRKLKRGIDAGRAGQNPSRPTLHLHQPL